MISSALNGINNYCLLNVMQPIDFHQDGAKGALTFGVNFIATTTTVALTSAAAKVAFTHYGLHTAAATAAAIFSTSAKVACITGVVGGGTVLVVGGVALALVISIVGKIG